MGGYWGNVKCRALYINTISFFLQDKEYFCSRSLNLDGLSSPPFCRVMMKDTDVGQQRLELFNNYCRNANESPPASFLSQTLHHSTQKLPSCLLVLNPRTLWDQLKSAQGLTVISEGAVAVLNTWIILLWVHARVWSWSYSSWALHQLSACAEPEQCQRICHCEMEMGIQLGLCTPSLTQLQGHPQP